MHLSKLLCTTLGLALAMPVAAQSAQKTPVEKILGKSENLAFVDVDVYTGDGKKLEQVTVLVEDGKIQKIGKGLAVPRSARRIDGGVLTPGFVLLGSTAGLSRGNSRPSGGPPIVIRGRRGRMRRMPSPRSSGSIPFTPNVKIAEKIDPKSKDFADWLKVGVTTHGVRPPQSGLSGIGAAVRPHGEDRADLVLSDESFLWLGMVSNTKTKKSISDGFEKAKALIESRKKAKTAPKPAEPAKKAAKPATTPSKKPAANEKKPTPTPPKPTPKPTPPKPTPSPAKQAPKKTTAKAPAKKPAPKKEDPRHATLAKSIDGKLGVMVGVAGAKDLLHGAQALEGHKVPLVIFHPFRRGTDDTLDHVIPLLVKLEAKVVCSADLGSKAATAVLTNPVAKMQAAGIEVILVPGQRASELREIWMRLNELHRSGAKPEKLIESLTLAPAKILGVDKRVGSIAKDKDANFLHFSVDPFSPAARLLHVYLEGAEVENVKTRTGS